MLDLSVLNAQQRLAVETIRGPVLILAGAGTGKTRVITYRIAHLLERGIPPANILAVTFTNKAAREMKERVAKLVPRLKPSSKAPKREGPTLCTFHSLGARILREHIQRLGYKRNFVIYSDSEQLSLIKRILSHLSAPGEKLDPRLILESISRFKNRVGAAGQPGDDAAAVARHLLPRYESALRACNALDFDDLLLLTLKLWREHAEVLRTYREKFRYVMVDEYQDTNAAQFQLVHLLTAEQRNLCVVGDDDQSIYGWRGAEIANLLDMEKHFRDVRIIRLEQNYRSTEVILNAANALISHNVRRRGKRLWSQRGAGAKITLHAFAHDEEEARTLVEEIEYLRLARRASWGEQAILFRTNQQSRPFEMALRQAGVRYHLIGGQSYFDRREVKDFIAYLKMFLHPHDDVSLLRIANVPPRGLSDVTMERLLAASQQRNCSVYEAMRQAEVQAQLPGAAQRSVRAFLGFIERTQAALHSRAPVRLQAWAETFLAEIAYLDDLRRSEKSAETAENRVRNLKELVASLEREGAPTTPAEQLEQFLEELMLDSERAEEEEPCGEAVTLITLHSCKGLEFPHVYIVGLEDGLLPHARAKEEGTLDEERRLFYVAITRAMQTLTLSCCLGRKKYGQLTPCHPSPFLKELPSDLIEPASSKGKRPVTPGEGKNLFATIRAAAS